MRPLCKQGPWSTALVVKAPECGTEFPGLGFRVQSILRARATRTASATTRNRTAIYVLVPGSCSCQEY